MDEIQLKKTKLFYELVEYVNELKENSDEIRRYSKDMFEEAEDDFERQNDRVFNINLYILIRLYKKEYNQMKNERGHFNLDDYYDFIDSIGLNDKMNEVYSKLPKMIARNEIVPYVTDNPSFMSMIR
ncbi:MAG: hypothetical protein IJ105_04510 [Bacilli bacterium]|nr:hypothetical protein [Bacilli bacterium]